MDFNNFAITKFINCFYAIDKKGRKKEFENRKYACFILTLSGKICFTSSGKSIVTSENCAVFLPQGLSYTNECLEDAESIVFNFVTLENYYVPTALSAVPQKLAKDCYHNIKKASASLSPEKSMLIMKELYSVASELFIKKEISSASDKILTQAIEYMMANSHDPSLTITAVAENCFISEIYLRKLFEKKLGATPFKMLTDIRMKKAYILAKEKRPIKEIAN